MEMCARLKPVKGSVNLVFKGMLELYLMEWRWELKPQDSWWRWTLFPYIQTVYLLTADAWNTQV